MILTEIIINWHFQPDTFDVLCLVKGFWKSFYLIEKNIMRITKVNMDSLTLIQGIKILLLKGSQKINNKTVYGIREISIKTGNKELGLKDCKENNGGLNKWYIEDADWFEGGLYKKFSNDNSLFSKNSNAYLDILNKLTENPPVIKKMIQKGKELKKKIEELDSSLGEMDANLNIFKEEYGLDGEGDSKILGASSKRFGKSCGQILRIFPYKKSGYYWIKPPCSKIPLRVYCDLSNKNSRLYAFFGSTGEKNLNNVKSLRDVRFECAKLGLEPTEIRDLKEIDSLQNYLNDLKVNLSAKAVIPIGYDYGCDRKMCNKRYHSLNSINSPDSTDIIKANINRKNTLNMAWSKSIKKTEENSVGFGLGKHGLVTFALPGIYPIKGVICSQNDDPDLEIKKFLAIDCDTKIRGNEDFNSIEFTNIKVKCPAQCGTKGKGKVWGSNIFKDDSSICKAGIHAGQLEGSEGGLIEISIEGPQKFFKGSDFNGIVSEDFDKPWDQSFQIKKFKFNCYIDNFINKNSFLELNLATNLREKNHLSLSDSIKASEKLLFKELAKLKIYNGENDLGINNSKNSSQNSTFSNESNSNDLTNKIDTSEEAIEIIERKFISYKTDIKNQLTLLFNGQKLLNEVNLEYAPLSSSDINPEGQEKIMSSFDIHIQGSLIEMKKVLEMAHRRVERATKNNVLLKKEILELQRFDSFDENYRYSLEKNWKVYDFRKIENGPSKWIIEKLNSFGRDYVISQKNKTKSFSDTYDASHLILNYKQIYDAIFRVSFFTKDDKRVGFAFRYIDPFNYYIFDMEKSGKGFKRLRKVVNGKSHVLAIKEDGGYLQNKWYRIRIKYKLAEIQVIIY